MAPARPGQELPFPRAELDRRLDRAREAMRESGVEAVLLFDPENVFYLTGYQSIGREFAGGHHAVKHAEGEYARGSVHSNTVESFNGLFKRSIQGAWHHISREPSGSSEKTNDRSSSSARASRARRSTSTR